MSSSHNIYFWIEKNSIFQWYHRQLQVIFKKVCYNLFLQPLLKTRLRHCIYQQKMLEGHKNYFSLFSQIRKLQIYVSKSQKIIFF